MFDLTVAQVNSIVGGGREVRYAGIAPYAPILVNVSGAGAATFDPGRITYNDEWQIGTNARFGNIAASILWNFTDTTSLSILGSEQVPGSFLAPAADVRITANTNGRIYVGGSLTTIGSGNELHSYPWAGTCDEGPDPDVDANADAGADAADAGADGADAGADAADAGADGADAGADAADAGADGADAGADAADAGADAADAGADGADAGADAADAGSDAATAAANAAAATAAADAANTSTDPATGGDLATTGGDAPMWLLGAGVVVLLGGVVLFASSRARRI